MERLTTAEDILKLIEEMDNEEKQKFLDIVFEEYYEGGGGRRHVIEK